MSDCETFGHSYSSNNNCGVPVCLYCNIHKGLTRCYCGWSESGGDGRQELIKMGENIEEE